MNVLKFAMNIIKNGGIKSALEGATKKIMAVTVSVVMVIVIGVIAIQMLRNSFLCNEVVQFFKDETETGAVCPKPPIDVEKMKDLASKLESERNKIYDGLSEKGDNQKFRSKEEIASDQAGTGDKELYSEAEYFIRTMAQIDLQTYIDYVRSSDLKKDKPLDNSPIDYSIKYANQDYKNDWNAWFKSEETKNKKFKKHKTHYLMNYRLKVYECFLLGTGTGLLGNGCSDEVKQAMGTDQYKSIATATSGGNFTYKTRDELLDKFYEISFIKYLDGKVPKVAKGDSKMMFDLMVQENLKAYNELYPSVVPNDSALSSGWLVPMIPGTYNFASPFGWRTHNGEKELHKGVDLGTNKIEAVPYFATRAGTVIAAGWNDGGYGGVVTIDHGDGFFSTYNHMKTENIVVKKGQKVEQGQLIGAAGNQPGVPFHLHFEICTSVLEGSGFNLQGGDRPKICSERKNPEDEQFGMSQAMHSPQNMSTTQKYASQFLSQWKPQANSGKAIIMPGFTGGSGLGKLSQKYEQKDPGKCNPTVEAGNGIACGAFQLTQGPTTATLEEFMGWLHKHKPEYFMGLATYRYNQYNTAYVNAWRAVYNADKTGFYQAQHDFIKYSHYDPVVKQVKAQYGYDVNTRPLAIQEMFWSSAVQHRAWTYQRIWGPAIGTSWKGKSDAAIVNTFYNQRINQFGTQGNRFPNERNDVLKMLGSV